MQQRLNAGRAGRNDAEEVDAAAANNQLGQFARDFLAQLREAFPVADFLNPEQLQQQQQQQNNNDDDEPENEENHEIDELD